MAKQLSPKAFTRSVVRAFMKDSGLEPRLLGENNRLKTIHGGTLASLVDLGGSLAVASTGRFATGVSTDLNVTYLSPGGKEGDILKGTATCDKIGKTLAFTTVTFTNSKGQLAARGSHTK
ncbi:putative esterase-like protein [Hapsidospora chrysogenum ATCC 11550]|uniref:Putative esterase-like protein n=1 Tax=Hapsidospora chrysogenum (strain ATCC 11550 / CBS 779.69 / DSM 880 / IAM 14645 / JCM 23072 / IMI 49137) TaxID=857340 RepID=A0A086TAH5_HAPC1|nr:putative esterase-like protein [Hapsidospora chrysogenum ATCC 11550]